ncbi:phenylalanine--tRNA ligase subunit beta [Candidatus Woesebacteria bacterium CG22_combo_CG10-13_8_21_14_all_45_10]|uniref:Phenylalanine--tRNA ligase beta subunit n=1 Tax=Candidatus Woesebacteria bacterium CG22_combo_CG10-13_8_21_14_all_45_10 TaxID=1975060 RepID=A0A2H0BHK3_9BACT|nr:MAG: phenylalanine--tRNA ligase subunit beta [Candidatus Woesebacteria bacterium CG22_combo_CG10-13_8_21_14_all_45_10]
MDIIIPEIWLRDFLKTKATAAQIAKCLSLCGPSVEKTSGKGNDLVYSIEVTTNRVDSASVYGIAREAVAILPMFKIQALLMTPKVTARELLAKTVDYLDASVDSDLCPRFAAILIRNIEIKSSPDWLQKRLILSGHRPINNIVDISNYIMLTLGQPTHTFDYDKIKNHKMILRKSNQGEKITTLDGKTHTLPGGDIVIEDASGILIDLAGIMGGQNSAVNENTKNVLFFVQTYNPVNIRKTSMALAHRTDAAVLFEKDLDPENVEPAARLGIDLFTTLAKGQPEAKILDIYPHPHQTKKLTVDYLTISKNLGINLPKPIITKILTNLGFKTVWKNKLLEVNVPSFRVRDINIAEDIVEEIARLYGYHHLPSTLMAGQIPDPHPDSTFDFETKVKNILKGFGGIETYTLSFVAKNKAGEDALKLQNPLGAESEYLRTSLLPSLTTAAKENSGEKEPFYLFEMANVYLPRKENLPEEKLMLAEIFFNTNFREAKGTIESLLESLHVKADFITEDAKYFLPSHRLVIKTKGQKIGQFGVLEEDNLIYGELEVAKLKAASREFLAFKPVPKYPAQIEDITLTFPEKTKVGEVMQAIYNLQLTINKVELKDVYKDAYTFRIWYQNPKKTLTNEEVTKIRNKILQSIKVKFGGVIKS